MLSRAAIKINRNRLIAYMFCICLLSATFVRWMNYVNTCAAIFLLVIIILERKIVKSKLCLFWAAYLIIYPLLDALIRGESGLSLYTTLCYLVPILLLCVADLNTEDFVKPLINFVKLFAVFQACGVYLSKTWTSLYVRIAWHLMGTWYDKTQGFATDASMVSYILCLGVGAYWLEFILQEKKNRKSIYDFAMTVFLLIAMVLVNKRVFMIGVYTALTVLTLILSINSKRRFIRNAFISIIVLVVATGICLLMYYQGANNALSRLGATIVGVVNDEDVSNSRSIWAAYMSEWHQDNLIFGIGWESFTTRLLDTPYAGAIPNGHNVYRQILCEEGYIGEIIFIILLSYTAIKCFYSLIRNYKRLASRRLIFCAFPCFVIIIFYLYCYTGNAIYDSNVYLPFFVAVKMASVATKSNVQVEPGRVAHYMPV